MAVDNKFPELPRYPQLLNPNIDNTWGHLIRTLERRDQEVSNFLLALQTSVSNAGGGAPGSGTVTSVGLLPTGLSNFLTVAGSPVSTAGNFTLTFVSGPPGTYLTNIGTWVSVLGVSAAAAASAAITSVNTVITSINNAHTSTNNQLNTVSAALTSVNTIAVDAVQSVGLLPTGLSNFLTVAGSPVSSAGNFTLTFVSGPNNTYLTNTGAWASVASGGGSGTVTSVGLLPTGLTNFLTVAGSPVSVAGNFTATFVSGPTNTYLGNNGTWVSIAGGGGASWGGITGTLSDQTDLNNVLTSLSAGVVSVGTVAANASAAITSVATELRNRSKYFYSTDFLNGGGVFNIWSGAGIGSGTLNIPNPADGTGRAHPGVLNLQRVSANTNSGYRIVTNEHGFLLRGGESTNLVAQFHTVDVSLFAYWGFHDSLTAAVPTDGCYFQIKGSDVQAVNRSNNVSASSGALFTAAASTWYRFNISVSPVSASAIYYRVFDMGSSVVASVNLGTNIPTADGRNVGNGLVSYFAASAKAVGLPLIMVDYMDVEILPVSGRAGI